MFGRIKTISELLEGNYFTKKDVEVLMDYLDEDDDEHEEVKELWEQIECYHEENFYVGEDALVDFIKEELSCQGVEIPSYIEPHIDWSGVAKDRATDISVHLEFNGENIYGM